MEPLLGPLRAALAANNMPSSWRLQQESGEDRYRRVEMVFEHAAGALVHLRFVAPGRGRMPVIRTAAYDVEAAADLRVPIEALAGLLDWARGRLVAALDAAAAPALADDAIARALHASLLMRGQQRVALHAERLYSRFAFPGWHLEPLCWASETTAELVARGPGGAEVSLRFTLGTRGNRSQVGVAFQPMDSSDQGNVRAVVDQLVVLLRGAHTAPAAAADSGVATAR